MMRAFTCFAALTGFYAAWNAAPVLWDFDAGIAIIATSATFFHSLLFSLEALTGKKFGITDEDLEHEQ